MKTLDQQLDELQETLANLYAGIHELDDEGKKKRQASIERILESQRKKFNPDEIKNIEEHLKNLEPHSKLIGNRDKNSDELVPDVNMRLHERYKILKMLLKKK
jgi:hypothetical protein